MTSGNQWREQKRLRRDLTPLNVATSARFAACRGRHQLSGDTILRQFAGKALELPICAVCGCPYNFPPLKRWGEQPI